MELQDVTNIFAAINEGHWALVAGLVINVLIWIARRMLGEKTLPASKIWIVNLAIGFASGMADWLVTDMPWYEAISAGLVVGASAGGLWSMLGKHVLPLPDKPPEE